MKKILSVITLALCATMMMAQDPVITFTKTEHDFGKINEADGRVTTIFEFKNEGMSTLVLSNVRASCGCTTPKWTREPVEPGQTGQITVTYNPNGRPGRFQKTITITSNATEPTTKLYIKGEVIPKPAKPVNNYPVQMGELSLKTKSINFGTLKKGQKLQREIEYANHTDHDLTVELSVLGDNYLVTQTSLETVKPQETGKFIFVFDAATCKEYGPVATSVLVVVNKKQIVSEEYKINLKAEVDEDFSNLSVDQLQQAPIIKIDNAVDFGTVAPGKKVKKALAIQNIGANPLIIRRVYSSSDFITAVAPKGGIKSGKKAEIKLDLNAVMDKEPMAAGSYSREIVVITNDPKQPKKHINITWNIQ